MESSASEFAASSLVHQISQSLLSVPPPPKLPSVSIIDVPLSRGRNQVALSAFAFLYSEIVQHSDKQTHDSASFADRLAGMGRHVGLRMLELLAYREAGSKREINIESMLNFIRTTIWKTLFNKPPDDIRKFSSGEYGIFEREPITNIYVSTKKDKSSAKKTGNTPNMAYFVGGIVEGILISAGFVSL